MNRKFLMLIALFISVVGTACDRKPIPIEYEKDNCAHCKMSIADKKYGAELITRKGRIYKFDAIECLAAYCIQKREDSSNIHSLWTMDYTNIGQWVDVGSATFLHSKNLPSPMGMFLSSFSVKSDAERVQKQCDGKIVTWQEILNLVTKEWVLKNDVPIYQKN